MRKVTLFALALVLVATAVFLAVAYDGNNAVATPTAWNETDCGGCHNGISGGVAPPAHTVAAHSSAMGTCTNCHSTASPTLTDAPIDVTKCVGCHGGASTIAAPHGSSCTGCHPAPTTTTTEEPSTTTTVGPTTTTVGPTTTTVGPTTTTIKSTTTTKSTTTSTTVPKGTPSYTG